MEAFLIQKTERYDVKGRKYIKTPVKYYYSDLRLRNAKLGFRPLEEMHLMENVLFNDLVRREFDVDVGVVEHNVRGEEKTFVNSWKLTLSSIEAMSVTIYSMRYPSKTRTRKSRRLLLASKYLTLSRKL